MSIFVFAAMLTGYSAHAQTSLPQNITVEGRFYDGSVPMNEAVNVKFEVLVQDAVVTNCVLYTETHANVQVGAATPASQGFFSLALGSGTPSGSNPLTPFWRVFSNSEDVTGIAGCAGLALANKPRVVRISVNKVSDGSGTYATLSPDTVITSVPTALVAETLNGKGSADFVQVKDDAATDLNQANLEHVFLSANFARLKELLNPSAAISLGSQRLSNLANPTAAQDAATKNYTDANLAGQTIDLVDVAPGFGGGKVLTWDSAANKWVAQVPSVAGTAGGDLTGTYPNPTIAALAVGTSKLANDAVTSAKINSTGVATNRLLVTDGTTGATVTYANCANDEILKYVSGTGWQCATVASLSAVTSVAGKSGAVTLNAADIGGLGTAAVRDVGTAAGEIPELDAMGKLTAGMIPSLGGDLSGTVDNASVIKIQGQPVAAVPPNANEVLRWNGSRWEASADMTGITALNGDITATGPGLAAATITNGAITTPKMFATPGANRLIATDGTTGATLTPFFCNLNETMQWTASGWTCVNVSTLIGTGFFADGGNTRGAAVSLGTNDNFALNFETNNTQVMTLTASGKVGIGTTNPAGNLDLVGTSTALNQMSVGGAARISQLTAANGMTAVTNGAVLGYFSNHGYDGADMQAATVITSEVDGVPGAGNMPGRLLISTTPAGSNTPVERMRISSAGNVGIGTTSPARLLHVAGAIRLAPTNLPGTPAAGDLAIDSGASNVLKFHNGTSWMTVGTGTGNGDFMANGSVPMSGNLRLNNKWLSGDGGNEGVYVDSAGLVGVGISTPSSALDVNGVVTGQQFEANSGGYGLRHQNGSVVYSSFLGNNYAQFGTESAHKLAFTTDDQDRMTILPATGYVGIGTSNPSRMLEVKGSLKLLPTTLPASPTAGDLAFNSLAANGLNYHNGTTWVAVGDFFQNGVKPMTGQLRIKNSHDPSIPDIAFSDETTTGIYSPGANSIGFATGGTGRMSVTNTGVLIGLIGGAARPLHVGGMIRLEPTALGGGAAAGDLAFDSAASNALKYHNGTSWITVGSGTGDFKSDGSVAMTGNIKLNGNYLSYNGANNGLQVKSDGNVFVVGYLGIGKSSPTNALDINGGLTASDRIWGAMGSVSGPAYSFSNDPDTGLFTPGNDTIAFGTGANERLRVDPAGRVGIGTTNPTQLLQVGSGPSISNQAAYFAGSILAQNANGGIVVPVVTSNTYNTLGAGSAIGFQVGSNVTPQGQIGGVIESLGPANGSLDFQTLSNGVLGSRMTITSGGKVGIGTTNPMRSLTVNGPIRLASGLLPSTPGAGDLAFDSASGNALKFHNGTSWTTVGNGDFMKDGSVAMTGNIKLNSNWLSGDGGNEGIYVDAAGNVGVGLAPSVKFDLLGKFRATDTYTGNSSYGIHEVRSTYSPSAAPGTVFISGLQNDMSTTGSMGLGNVRADGLTTTMSHYGSTTLYQMTGHNIDVATNGSGSATVANGIYTRVVTGTAPIINATAVDAVVQASGANISTAKGMHVQVAGTPANIGTAYGLHIDTVNGTSKYALYQSDASAPNFFAGDVGIGTSTVNSKLTVNGSTQFNGNVVQKVVNDTYSTALTNIDWNQGTIIVTTKDCTASPGDFVFSNLKSGGNYTFVVAPSSGTSNVCMFPGTIDAVPVTYRFMPANSARVPGSHTMYNFMRVGSVIYVTWTTGF